MTASPAKKNFDNNKYISAVKLPIFLPKIDKNKLNLKFHQHLKLKINKKIIPFVPICLMGKL
jgi:hypothetical protein